MEHKSIFSKINEYSSNPVKEYNKIVNFLDTECSSYTSIKNKLSQYFCYSNELVNIYTNYEHCVNDNTKTLRKNCILSNEEFNRLDDNIMETLLDEFLTFCEILAHLFLISIKNDSKLLNNAIYCQTFQLIQGSLKSINYKANISDKKCCIVEVIKNNPEAEAIADESSPEIKKTIYHFLSCRNTDVDNRKSKIHELIDLIEPLLSNYNSLDMVKKVKEYSQLLRHPEEKKNEDHYKWFYKDINIHLDEIFDLCIFVLYYDKSKTIVKQYEANKRDILK